MSKVINSQYYFYYPKCREKGCEGLLEINFNEENFTINYKCEKNENHKGENIYFDTFEKLFLSKNIYKNCMKVI